MGNKVDLIQEKFGGYSKLSKLSPSKKNVIPSKMMIALQKWWKMLFISSQKVFSFSRYLNFLSWLFGHVEKTAWLERLD